MGEFLNREGAKQVDTAPNFHRRFSELKEFCAFGSHSHGRIGNTPMGNDRLARKDGTGFFGFIADCDDDIEARALKLIPRLACARPARCRTPPATLGWQTG